MDVAETNENNSSGRGKYRAGMVSLYLLGLSMKLGGCFSSWSNGFRIGFWQYFIFSTIVAAGYGMLALSIAELVSITAFPGGFYGYVRCALGPFWGYLVGCSGLIESIFYVAVSILKVGQAVTTTFHLERGLEPLWWTVSFIIILLFHIRGGVFFWRFMALCTFTSLISLAIYLFGSMPHMDFGKYAYNHGESDGFDGSIELSLLVMRLPSWFFIGIDLLTVTSREVLEPTKALPMIILAVYCTMSLLCLWIEVTVISQAPGFSSKLYDLNTIFPLAFGYSQILNISVHAGALFSIIPPFASALGYVFVAGRQMHSMATSGLLPPIFRITYGDHYTPIVSMITIAVISAAALIAAWHVNPHTMLFRMAILGGCVVYISMFFCFSIFKMRFGNMPRQFINPLGHFSSIFGIIIFSVMLISLIVFQPVFEVIVTYAIYMLCAIFYYYFVAETRQFFSEDEQRLFLKAYIVNANRRRRQTTWTRLLCDVQGLLSACLYPLTAVVSTWRAAPAAVAAEKKVVPQGSGESTAAAGPTELVNMSSASGEVGGAEEVSAVTRQLIQPQTSFASLFRPHQPPREGEMAVMHGGNNRGEFHGSHGDTTTATSANDRLRHDDEAGHHIAAFSVRTIATALLGASMEPRRPAAISTDGSSAPSSRRILGLFSSPRAYMRPADAYAVTGQELPSLDQTTAEDNPIEESTMKKES